MIAGVNPQGVPVVAVSAMARPAGATCRDFATEPPRLLQSLADPLDLHQLQETAFLAPQDPDMRCGNNFASLDGLLLERQAKQLFPATFIDLLTCKFQFVQNRVQTIDGAEPVGFAQCKLHPQVAHVYDLQVETAQQILSPQEVEEAVRAVEAALQGQADMQELRLRPLVEREMLRRDVRCLFCGGRADATSVPLVFGLALLKRPAFQAVFNPPVLCCAHKRCAEHTPEVDLQDFVLKGDQTVPFEVAPGDPALVRLLVYDRYMRKATMQQSGVLYDNLREAMKPARIQLPCKVCGQQGAVIGCFNARCDFTGHHDCILGQGLRFNGKEIFCREHQK